MNELEAVIEYLRARHLMLATAESCTAGLIAAKLAEIPGIGAVLECGYIVYSVRAKSRCLGVSRETIESAGLTSEAVAQEMAVGALQASCADIALANTGEAESDDELDGVVCIACALRCGERIEVVSETVRFEGGRNEVRLAATLHALGSLPRYHGELQSKSDDAKRDA